LVVTISNLSRALVLNLLSNSFGNTVISEVSLNTYRKGQYLGFDVEPTSTSSIHRSAEKAAKASKVDPSSDADEPEPRSDVEGEGSAPPSPKPKKRKAKGSGGMQVPAEWPWKEAKRVFEQPDVIPGSQIQVCAGGTAGIVSVGLIVLPGSS
jgi:hypothetical protein